MAPRAGLEPATTRLTAECSTIELSGNAVVSVLRGARCRTQIYCTSREFLATMIFKYGGRTHFLHNSAIFVWLRIRVQIIARAC